MIPTMLFYTPGPRGQDAVDLATTIDLLVRSGVQHIILDAVWPHVLRADRIDWFVNLVTCDALSQCYATHAIRAQMFGATDVTAEIAALAAALNHDAPRTPCIWWYVPPARAAWDVLIALAQSARATTRDAMRTALCSADVPTARLWLLGERVIRDDPLLMLFADDRMIWCHLTHRLDQARVDWLFDQVTAQRQGWIDDSTIKNGR